MHDALISECCLLRKQINKNILEIVCYAMMLKLGLINARKYWVGHSGLKWGAMQGPLQIYLDVTELDLFCGCRIFL